jgi:hypothetical protein
MNKIQAIKAKLARNDNPTLAAGLIYALTVLEPHCECKKSVSVKQQDSHFTEIKSINPLRKRVYERLEKMKLKDLADKVNEAVKELNKLKNERP